MSKKIKLPNGEDYTIQNENDVHVFMTHLHGEEINNGFVQCFNHRVWGQMKKASNTPYTYEVIHDPTEKKKAPAKDSGKQSAKGKGKQAAKKDAPPKEPVEPENTEAAGDKNPETKQQDDEKAGETK